MHSLLNYILRRQDVSTTLILLYIFFGITYPNWRYSNTYSNYYEIDLIIGIFAIILSTLLFFANLFIIAHFTGENINNFSWYSEKLKISYSSISNNINSFSTQLISLQIINAYLSYKFVTYYYVWFILLITLYLYLFFSDKLKEHSFYLTNAISSILMSISVFVVINFKKIGIYYMFLFSKLLITIEGDESIFITEANMWNEYGNIVLDKEKGIVFYVFDFIDILKFYLYPTILLILILNVYYFYGRKLKISKTSKS